ncbi:transcriptional regulator [Snodgrassella alvi]|nr:transcriptional regulator [Snodgrassella alvi]
MMHTNDSCAITHRGKRYHCNISLAMNLIGGKWKGVILYYLRNQPKRFSELRKNMPDITEMTLSLQLKQLEKDELITRTVKGDKPPVQVSYALTNKGHLLSPILMSLCNWAEVINDENQKMP